MAQRNGNTVGKRQKEQARKEKQHAKQQRKIERNLEKRNLLPASQSAEPGPSTGDASRSALFSEMENATSKITTNEGEM